MLVITQYLLESIMLLRLPILMYAPFFLMFCKCQISIIKIHDDTKINLDATKYRDFLNKTTNNNSITLSVYFQFKQNYKNTYIKKNKKNH